MNDPFAHHASALLPCPYCAQQHIEDLPACPTSRQIILLDGKYRLKRLLGEGSFGLVWDARNIDTQKEVAIKTLRAEVIDNPAVLARFSWEATAAGRIHDPHVCDVLDLVKSSVHGPYIVLERLSGQSLEALMQQEGRLAPEQAVLLIRQALVGLEAVHRAGIVHRDIKPENIFLHAPGPGRVQVKLLDFGISKFGAGGNDQARTAADLYMGTPEYTSPEQARGAAQVDLRTDIWAIGAILYKALTGVAPFTGPDVPSLLTAILHTPHRALTELAADVAAELAAVVERCLAKPREMRYQTCAELSAALEPFERGSLARAPVDARNLLTDDPTLRTRLSDPARVWTQRQAEDELEVVDPGAAAAPASASQSGPDGGQSGSQQDGKLAAAVDRSRAPASAGDVILCCNLADRRWLDHLRQHLKTHRDGSHLGTWDCGASELGAPPQEVVATSFARARAVILLVSPQFLADDFAAGSRLFSLVFMAQARGLPVLWFVIHECAYETSDLLDFTSLGDPARPLDRLPFTEADRALEQICDQVISTLGGPQLTPDGSRPQRALASSTRTDEALQLEQRLEMAQARRARLEAQGEDTTSILEEINMLRRSLRTGRPLHRGDVLDDRFVVLDQLGSGGFATVWRALDKAHDVPVALKVLHAQHVHNAERRGRFFRGARVMAQLDHPNIVKIILPWASDGEYEYYVMHYVAGGTLRDAVLGRGLSPGKRIQLLLAVADALAFAHERGIIHRDVKPSNILVADDGTPYLTDFDLVRAEDTTGGTAGGLGTVIYAAPEMMERASEADARADVYSLGMTLAFMFYERDLTMEVIRNTDQLIGELKVPEAIRMVIRTAITWNRDHRFPSAAEFRSALAASFARRDSQVAHVVAAALQNTILAPIGGGPPVRGGDATVLAAATPVFVAPGAAASEVAGSEVAASEVPASEATASEAAAPVFVAPGSAAPVFVAPGERRDGVPAAPRGHAPSASLARAFAAISRASDAERETAISEVFAQLEVHDDLDPAPPESARRPPAAALVPADDHTQPDTIRRLTPATIGVVAVGAGVLVVIVYLLLAG